MVNLAKVERERSLVVIHPESDDDEHRKTMTLVLISPIEEKKKPMLPS